MGLKGRSPRLSLSFYPLLPVQENQTHGTQQWGEQEAPSCSQEVFQGREWCHVNGTFKPMRQLKAGLLMGNDLALLAETDQGWAGDGAYPVPGSSDPRSSAPVMVWAQRPEVASAGTAPYTLSSHPPQSQAHNEGNNCSGKKGDDTHQKTSQGNTYLEKKEGNDKPVPSPQRQLPPQV